MMINRAARAPVAAPPEAGTDHHKQARWELAILGDRQISRSIHVSGSAGGRARASQADNMTRTGLRMTSLASAVRTAAWMPG